MQKANRLQNETSPYLLQHAHNPVDWYPWGEEALAKAKEEDKLILVSIGYAACHWCHVMERESFEDPSTAELMNRHFISIKIDREERPDLDHLFMDALQAISGQGGWPLNMFLTPDGRPFYGGTYFPHVDIHNRISWKNLLIQLQQAFISRRNEIEEQANHLTEHLQSVNKLDPKKLEGFSLPLEEKFTHQQTQKIRDLLMQIADKNEGGFGRAPKFPQTFSISYLLRYYHFQKDQEALDQAQLSLKKMMRGGIFDQIGGGFCRYSTDAYWLAPHFEKMTYDNALLLMVMAEAYQITRDPEYAACIEHTISFMMREMLGAEGCFYAALDADSEGVEGKFYTWSFEEFNAVLGQDGPLLSTYWDVKPGGNWEGTNILRVLKPLKEWASEHGLHHNQAIEIVQQSAQKLLSHRSTRIRPGTDDKIILGWNALMNHAIVSCGLALQNMEWISFAEKHMAALFQLFNDTNSGHWRHTYKSGEAKFYAYLDDLAPLIRSLLLLQEATSETAYLDMAKELTEYVIEHFSDEEGLFFYFSPVEQTDVLVRKKDLYDGAIPSGNGLMAWNLYQLGILFDIPKWKERSVQMLEIQKDTTVRHPNSFGIWAALLMELTQGTHEVVVMGANFREAVFGLLEHYIPNRILMSAPESNEKYPLFAGKSDQGPISYYHCRDYTCKRPVFSEVEILKELVS